MAPQSLDPATFDRTDLTTRHEGPLVLPHDLLFHRLHFLAFYSNTSAVKDAFGGIDVNYRQLLSDVVAARNRIRAAISAKALDAIYDEREASFVLIARGYEFVVLFLAVLALGGIAVPTSIHITQKELSHVLRTSRASATICSGDYTSIAQSGSPAKENEEDYVVVTLDDMVDNTPWSPGIDAVERELYQTAVSNIEQFHCGSAALPTSIASRWAALCRGRQIAERYGGTEFGNPFAHSPGIPVVTGSVGTTNPGIESYLEQGEEGEIFVRSPFLFSKYIYDIEATKKSLTADGFFKTGDVAEKHGENFFIKGRKSVDILKSGGYKISALDVERQILEHPIITEAIVVGVDDDEFGQRIAAAVVLNEGADSLSLPELRSFLRDKLSSYKLPTILRVVRELPKTTTLKVPKLLIKKDLFGTDHLDIQKWSASSVKL
ncbi:hypothetical protein LTR40_003328 [Exophiala xenobiotica]|nr:hypothetical protein LTR40_003328 [Exophiala xenobiotica]